MELLIRPLAGVINPIMALPRLVRLVCLIVGGFTVITLGMPSVGQAVPQPLNPFLEFADFFPGQPATILQNSPFSCQKVYSSSADSARHCYFHPTAGIFSSIDLTVVDSNITQTNFILRNSSVRVGDFRGWWETKPVRAFQDVAFLFLPDWVIIARTIGHREHSFPFKYVWSVTFTQANEAAF